MTSTQLPRGGVHRVHTPVGHQAWLVTNYARVRLLLDDDRLGRSHPEPDTAARTGESALFGGPLGNFNTEVADHARMRNPLQPQFLAQTFTGADTAGRGTHHWTAERTGRAGPAGRSARAIGAAAANSGDLRTARSALFRPRPIPRLVSQGGCCS